MLLSVAGAPWVQANPDVWIALLMADPLDAFRITVLFSVERAAFSGLGGGSLTTWWSSHSAMWLGVLCCFHGVIAGLLAWAAMRRRTDEM